MVGTSAADPGSHCQVTGGQFLVMMFEEMMMLNANPQMPMYMDMPMLGRHGTASQTQLFKIWDIILNKLQAVRWRAGLWR